MATVRAEAEPGDRGARETGVGGSTAGVRCERTNRGNNDGLFFLECR